MNRKPPNSFLRRPPRVQRGLTLIELMVSLAVGLVLLAGMTTLFVNQSRTQANLDKSSRMIENGRYATQLIVDDLQVAGYFGELQPAILTYPGATPPDPCATDVGTLLSATSLHVQGVNNATAAPGSCGTVITDLKPQTDILVVRRANTVPVNLDTVPASGNTTRYLQVTLCRTEPVNDFHVDTVKTNFTLHARDCAALANVRRYLVRIYYIANNSNGAGGDGIPTLMRAELDADGTFKNFPQVEGIENLQLEYGRDNTGDNVADATDNCAACTDAAFSNTLTMRVHLLARNLEPTVGYLDTKSYTLGDTAVPAQNDAFKRHVYSQFVRLLNPAGRRD